jgi:hypothetical protein
MTTRTKRGKHLAQYPLLMVGADYNTVAQEVARKTLADARIPSLVLFGDITDPIRFARDLRQHGLDIRRGLHVRAFIDHNRRYQRPERNRTLSSPSTGAYIDDDGATIPNHLLEEDLVSFLERWVPYVGRHGLVLLEAHCVDPRIASRHAGETHNIVFDTYHGFSLQYPIDFETFMEAAWTAGLDPVLYHQKRYPSRRPFVSISNNYHAKNRLPDSGRVGASLRRPAPLVSSLVEEGRSQVMMRLGEIGIELERARSALRRPSSCPGLLRSFPSGHAS